MAPPPTPDPARPCRAGPVRMQVYDGAVLRFTATLPDAYPFKPAVVSFVDTVVHPLVEGGHRFSHCMSKANW